MNIDLQMIPEVDYSLSSGLGPNPSLVMSG
jgi:hypothetical protein